MRASRRSTARALVSALGFLLVVVSLPVFAAAVTDDLGTFADFLSGQSAALSDCESHGFSRSVCNSNMSRLSSSPNPQWRIVVTDASGQVYVVLFVSLDGSCPAGQTADSSGKCVAAPACDASYHQINFTDHDKWSALAGVDKATLANGTSYNVQVGYWFGDPNGGGHGFVSVQQDCNTSDASGPSFPDSSPSAANDTEQCATNLNGNKVCVDPTSQKDQAAKCPGGYGTVNGNPVCVDKKPAASNCAVSSDGTKACLGDTPSVKDASGDEVYPDMSKYVSSSSSESIYDKSTASKVVSQDAGPDFGVTGSGSSGGSGSDGSGSDGSGSGGSSGSGDGSGDSSTGCTPGTSDCPMKIDGSGLKSQVDDGTRYNSAADQALQGVQDQLQNTALPSNMPTGKGLIDRFKSLFPTSSSCSEMSVKMPFGKPWVLPGATGCNMFTAAKAVLAWALALWTIIEIQNIFFGSVVAPIRKS